MRTLFLLASVAALANCANSPLGPDFEKELTRMGGCGDVIFYAVDGQDEVMLTLQADGLVIAAREAQSGPVGETVTVIEFPSPDAEVTLVKGSRVSDATCDDVIENDGPRVRDAWTAVAGTATVRIRTTEDQHSARGDLLLEDVVLESDGGRTVGFSRLEWTDVSVGWFPG